jgi:hypothetical protein
VYWGKTAGQCPTGVSLAYSPSLAGPWSVEYDVLNFSCTNPGAPVFTADGSLLMAYKAWADGGKGIGVVTAPSWRAWPYHTFPVGNHTPDSFIGVAAKLEDPSNLWIDRRGAIHMLFHEAAWGGASASGDGGSTWDYRTARVVYNYSIPFEDGSALDCTHREEPKVLLDADGRAPVLLITQCIVPSQLPLTRRTAQYPDGEAQFLTRIIMQPINTL